MIHRNVFVGFYTGEYTRALLDALPDKVWWDVKDKMVFGMGFSDGVAHMGGDAMKGEEYDDAWGEYLKRETADYIVSPTTPLADFQTAVFLRGDNVLLFKTACDYARTLRMDLTEIGGDDTVYDYYPDAVEALYQLCKGIGGDASRKVYEELASYAWEEKYKDVGEWGSINDCFPMWDKEVKA